MRKHKSSVKPEPGLDPHPVDRLIILAEELQKLSGQVLSTANEVRQGIQGNGPKKNGT